MALRARRHRAVHGGCLAHRARRAAARGQAAGAARRRRPRRAQRPDPLRLLAARGRRGGVRSSTGPRPACVGRSTAVEEDAGGITLTSDWVEDADSNGLFLAHALGRFAGADLGVAPVARAGPAAPADPPRGASRRVADPGADGRRRPGGQPVDATRALPPRVRRPAGDRPPRRRRLGQPARSRGRPGARHRLAEPRGRPGRHRPRAADGRRPGGAGAAARRLPAGDGRRRVRGGGVRRGGRGWGPASSRPTRSSAVRSGRWRGSRRARVRSRPSSATRAWRRTCGPWSGWPARSRPWSGPDQLVVGRPLASQGSVAGAVGAMLLSADSMRSGWIIAPRSLNGRSTM